MRFFEVRWVTETAGERTLGEYWRKRLITRRIPSRVAWTKYRVSVLSAGIWLQFSMDKRQIIVQYEMMTHSNNPVSESVIIGAGITGAVQEQYRCYSYLIPVYVIIIALSICYTLLCFYLQIANHPVAALLPALTRVGLRQFCLCRYDIFLRALQQ